MQPPGLCLHTPGRTEICRDDNRDRDRRNAVTLCRTRQRCGASLRERRAGPFRQSARMAVALGTNGFPFSIPRAAHSTAEAMAYGSASTDSWSVSTVMPSHSRVSIANVDVPWTTHMIRRAISSKLISSWMIASQKWPREVTRSTPTDLEELRCGQATPRSSAGSIMPGATGQPNRAYSSAR